MSSPPASKVFQIHPIGEVLGGRDQPLDDDWAQSRAQIQLDSDRFTAAALSGLDAFSHIEVVFLFDRVSDADIITGARHPRGREDWPLTGIFAQRAKNRPNRLGVSVCRLLAVDGLSLTVQGLDAIDGTPVIDIKPVMAEFLPRGDIRQPAWSRSLMVDYW